MEIDRLVEEKIRSRGAEKLMKACHQSLFLGIEQAVVGNRTGDIGYAIDGLAQHYEYGNVREFTGHAVEPMLTLGSWVMFSLGC
ncbi:M24 family metallopeptidase [Paenibacillus maysiensis]|uniref:M24 family metallopeptidase n=1 Tax=Paenibacillus maysiensis TaxID=1155954 RepID=UPI0004B7B49C|nr:M24 family metallopeptidase [Paenibacillus maysiensis]